MVQCFCVRFRSRFRLKKFEPKPESFLTGWSCQGSLFFGIIANSLLSCMRFLYHAHYVPMCLIIFEEKAEIQDQYPLSLIVCRNIGLLTAPWPWCKATKIPRCMTRVTRHSNTLFILVSSSWMGVGPNNFWLVFL